MDLQREDNILFEKINSLDYLPDGYQPDLASKWRIIEAGKEKKRAAGLGFIKIAAILCLVSLFFLLYLKFNSPEVLVVDEIKPSPLNKPEAKVPVDEKKLPEVKVVLRVTGMKRQLAPTRVKAVPEVVTPAQLIVEQHPVQPILEIPAAKNEVTVAVPKPRRRMFKQLDFGEPVPVKSENMYASEQPAFQIVLFPNTRKTYSNEADESGAFTLKKSF